MSGTGIDHSLVISKAAQIANEAGLEQLTLKKLAEELGIKSPSLYRYIEGLDDLKRRLMIYGWRQMENRIIQSVIGIGGYDAVRGMCYAFYDYATENPGVFKAMLWYNKFQDEGSREATAGLLSVIFRIASCLHFPEEYCYHLIRTVRGFLEGFILLVDHGSFGHSLPFRDSFEISVEILIDGMKALESRIGSRECGDICQTGRG